MQLVQILTIQYDSVKYVIYILCLQTRWCVFVSLHNWPTASRNG